MSQEIDEKVNEILQAMMDIKLHDRDRMDVEADLRWKIMQLGPDAIPSLITVLDDPDEEKRLYALGTLSSFGGDAFDGLLGALNNSSKRVRISAAGNLGAIGDARALEPLKKLLESEEDVRDRKHIQHAISALGDPEERDDLSENMRSDNWRTRKMAVQRMTRQGAHALPQLIEALSDPHQRVRRSALHGIVGQTTRKNGLATHVYTMLKSDEDAEVRTAAAKTLLSNNHKFNYKETVAVLDEAAAQEKDETVLAAIRAAQEYFYLPDDE